MASKRVLVIDDEEDIREVAQASLEIMAGMEVFLASSSQEGLIAAETKQPDAILLDVMLPNMDGLTLFRKLQENPATCHIPVILLTAKVQVTDQKRFAAAGVTAIIAKPFKPAKLVQQLCEVLNWQI
jgi:two-component system, OmpR family, alkaline phosphatase synthesis response regulator PhoP